VLEALTSSRCAMLINTLKTLKLSILIAIIATLSGCVTGKSITKPRSEVIAEAKSKGVEMASEDEERNLFFQTEKDQKERLLSLVRNRTQSEFRDQNYRMGPADAVEINVFDVPELNMTATVTQSGFVQLPLVGAVKAGGLTETEFQQDLRKRLASYVRQPQVNVFISNYGSQKVAVLGAVNKAGTYPLKKGANSILELISEAGGVNDKAGSYLNFVPSELSGIGAANDAEARARLALSSDSPNRIAENGIEVYLDQVMGTSGGIPLEIPVRGGDMIIIPEAGKATVDGEVEKRGSYELGRQMTLLGALAAAGGITYGAKVDEVEVVRDVGAKGKARLVLDLERIARGEDTDVRLRNGDLVRVPSDTGKRMKQDTYEAITRILNFGVGGNVQLVH
jgi:polysaccharide export outer membrane protein